MSASMNGQAPVKENAEPTSSAPPATTPPEVPSIQADHNSSDTDKHAAVATMEASRHRQTKSDISIDTTASRRSRKEYMDALIPPSGEEMSRISQIQLEREQEDRRKSREKEKERRKSIEASQSALDVQDKPKRSSIFGHHRQKKSDAAHNDQIQSISTVAPAIASANAVGTAPAEPDDPERYHAAMLIQRTYRGYKTRREMKGLGLNADTRWTHALRDMRFREVTRPRGKDDIPVPVGTEATLKGLGASDAEAARKSSSARYKWKKVALVAAHAAADMDEELTSPSGSDLEASSSLATPEKRKLAHEKREAAKARRRKDARVMGLQYFLEMVDQKHRYGSNLRTYHAEWKRAETQEPFFYWLDYGEGRNLDLTTCPRERLDREQVRYLSKEERQYYRVQVDSQGRLCWAKNGARIDTTEQWKDSIHGIVPVDDPTPAFKPKSTNPNQPKLFPSDSSAAAAASSSSSSPGSRSTIDDASESEAEAARAAKYATPGFQDAKGVKKVTHLSAATVFNTLLRKSVRKNTWIFVADTSFRLYVGIKDSGAFQHSSFLQGSRISAAGLIKIKDGRLASLSPLSGHYRPPASNFRAFVHSMRDEGVDMSHVSISKSYAVLVGLEAYMKTRQKGSDLVKRAAHKKDKVVHPEEAQKREEEERDKSESAEKERKFLEQQAGGQEKKPKEKRASFRLLQKLGMSSTLPKAGKAEG